MANKIHPQARAGETVHDLMRRAKKPKHDSGKSVVGELKVATCQSPLHDMRAGLDDEHLHSDELGVYDGVAPPPHICNRCAAANGAAIATAREAKRSALKAAFKVDDAALDLLLNVARE